ncbi:MAG: CBS domain-containing protein, partial [Proteobacteria bacterium]
EQALQLMKRNNLSDLLVMDRTTEPQKLLGIISDREIALSLLENADVAGRRVTELMTDTHIVASEGDDFFQLVRQMEEAQLSRLPVANAEGRVVSIVTAKDLLQLLVNTLLDVRTDPKSKTADERVPH